jgi:hypothetical protein
MIRIYHLCGIMFLLFMSCSGSMMDAYFRIRIHFDDFRFDINVIDIVKSPAFYGCALECVRNDICLSFQYNTHLYECRLLNVLFLSRYSAIGDSGWRYFEKTGGKASVWRNRECHFPHTIFPPFNLVSFLRQNMVVQNIAVMLLKRRKNQ